MKKKACKQCLGSGWGGLPYYSTCKNCNGTGVTHDPGNPYGEEKKPMIEPEPADAQIARLRREVESLKSLVRTQQQVIASQAIQLFEALGLVEQ